MRTVRLVETAARAESLRLRRVAQRMVVRGVLLVVALGFLALGVGFAHLVAWMVLQPRYGDALAALGLMLGDLAIAGGLALLAAGMKPGRIEIEARVVREQAWHGVRQSLDPWALMVAVARIFAARRTGGTR